MTAITERLSIALADRYKINAAGGAPHPGHFRWAGGGADGRSHNR